MNVVSEKKWTEEDGYVSLCLGKPEKVVPLLGSVVTGTVKIGGENCSLEGIRKSGEVEAVLMLLSYAPGPSGGIVFYDKGYVSDGWRFLEVSPKDAGSKYVWGPSTDAGTSESVGSGKKNTELIAESRIGKDTVSRGVKEFRQGGKSDWFVPSMEELNLMYENLYLNGVGNFSDKTYWSSSEIGLSKAYYINFRTGKKASMTSMDASKGNEYSLRPVRAYDADALEEGAGKESGISTETESEGVSVSVSESSFVVPRVSFYDDNGALISTVFVDPGEEIVFPSGFEYGGWDLLGWREDGSDKIVTEAVMTDEHLSFTAVYGHTITYHDTDGTVIAEADYLKSDLTVTVNGGYTSPLTGIDNYSWKDENGIEYRSGSSVDNPACNMSLTAVYQIIVSIYDITGKLVKKVSLGYGESLTIDGIDDSDYTCWSYSDDMDTVYSSSTVVIEKPVDIILRSRYDLPISASSSKTVSAASGDTEEGAYAGSVVYGSTAYRCIVYYVDKVTGEFFETPSEVSDWTNIIRCSIPENWFTLSGGNILLSDNAAPASIEYLYIPSSIGGVKVTGIGDSAFGKCSRLRYVRIPNTVIRYGSCAFSGCSSLVMNELDIGNVTAIGACAFSGTTIRKIITTGSVPYSYSSSSSSHPFYNVSGFEDLCILYGGTVIDNMLSSSMKKTVRRVNIPSTITTIMESAFDGCTSLKVTLSISENIRKIGNYAFENSGITFLSVDLSGAEDSCSVGYNAFTGTTVKKLVVNNNGVNSYNGSSSSSYPFYGVKGFETLEFKNGTTTTYNVLSSSMRSTITHAVIPSSLKSYATSLFEDCTKLKQEMVITPTVTNIGNYAFEDSGIIFSCVDLSGASASSSVGYNAFTGTTVKKLVVNNNGVNSYNGSSSSSYPFYGVKGFETLEFKNGTTTTYNILSSAMRNTIKHVIIPSSVKVYAASLFENCTNLKEEMSVSSKVTSIGNYAFQNSGITFVCVDLTGMTSSVSVGYNAFTGTPVRKLIVNENGVLSYYGCSSDSYPFYGIKDFETLEYVYGTKTAGNILSSSMRATLRTVVLPSSISVYSECVFENCRSLKMDMAITSDVTSIGNYAFRNSAITFTSVDLSGMTASVAVGYNAFTGTTVKKLVVNNNGVLSFYGCSSDSYPFYGIKGFKTLEYRRNTTTALNVLSSGMRSSVTEVILPSSIKVYSASVFENCTALNQVMTIASNVTNIGNYAFRNSAVSFNSIDLTGTKDSFSVGYNAFTGITVKKLIVNDGGVRSYYSSSSDSYPFYGVKGFETLEYSNGTTTASNVLSSAMRKTVTSVILPASIAVYSASVFENCSNLKQEMKIPATVTSIGNYAFRNSAIIFSSVDLTGTTASVSVGYNAFTGTFVKKLVVNDGGVRSYNSSSSDSYSFYSVSGFRTLEYKTGTTTAYNVLSSSMRKTVTEIIIPSTVKTIVDSAFADCTSLRTIKIPASATIGNNTFYNCTAAVRYY